MPSNYSTLPNASNVIRIMNWVAIDRKYLVAKAIAENVTDRPRLDTRHKNANIGRLQAETKGREGLKVDFGVNLFHVAKDAQSHKALTLAQDRLDLRHRGDCVICWRIGRDANAADSVANSQSVPRRT